MPTAEPMASFSCGTVVRVPFPYTNRQVQQHRPALVVSDGTLANGLLLWVVMITSAQNRPWPGDEVIEDIGLAGLPVASVIRPTKIATIEAKDADPIGKVTNQTLRHVQLALLRQLGLQSIA